MAGVERSGERRRVVDPPGKGQCLLAQCVAPPRIGLVGKLDRKPGQQPHPEPGMFVADRRQRLLEDRDHPNVGAEDRDAGAAQGQRAASDEVRAIRRARQLDRPCERALCIIGESRTLKRLSEQALELGLSLR